MRRSDRLRTRCRTLLFITGVLTLMACRLTLFPGCLDLDAGDCPGTQSAVAPSRVDSVRAVGFPADKVVSYTEGGVSLYRGVLKLGDTTRLYLVSTLRSDTLRVVSWTRDLADRSLLVENGPSGSGKVTAIAPGVSLRIDANGIGLEPWSCSGDRCVQLSYIFVAP